MDYFHRKRWIMRLWLGLAASAVVWITMRGTELHAGAVTDHVAIPTSAHIANASTPLRLPPPPTRLPALQDKATDMAVAEVRHRLADQALELEQLYRYEPSLVLHSVATVQESLPNSTSALGKASPNNPSVIVPQRAGVDIGSFLLR